MDNRRRRAEERVDEMSRTGPVMTGSRTGQTLASSTPETGNRKMPSEGAAPARPHPPKTALEDAGRDKAKPPQKPGVLRRMGKALSAAMGWPCGRRFLSTLSPTKPLALWSRTRVRLADNLAREDEVRKDFARLLLLWGIREEELDEHVAMRTREAVGTGFLTLVSAAFLAANFLNPAPAPLVRLLAAFAAASFLAASLLMCLAALWRVKVLKTRHFVPFLSWVCSPLVPSWRAKDGTGQGTIPDRPDQGEHRRNTERK